MFIFKKYAALLLLIIILLISALCISKIEISENLNSTIPSNAYLQKLAPVIEKGKRAIVFSMEISNFNNDNYAIDSAALVFISKLENRFAGNIGPLQYKSDIDAEVFSAFLHRNIFLFLEQKDYELIDSLLQKNSQAKILSENKNQLNSTKGIGMGSFIAQDPLHFMAIGLDKLSATYNLSKLASNDGLFISEDGKKLLFTSQLLFDINEVSEISTISSQLKLFSSEWNQANPAHNMDYFGSFLITEANATQIRKDIILTVNLALLFIVGLLFFYYRNVSTILFFLLPGFVGITSAIATVYLIQGSISALALSSSAVIMGIVVDYSFHYFSHLSQNADPIKTRNQILLPLLFSSLTTIAAFFSLMFAQSGALQDFGLFTGLSLVFTLLFILFLFPRILNTSSRFVAKNGSDKLNRLIDRLGKNEKKAPWWALVLYLATTLVLGFFASDVQFESDLNNINYYPDYLKQKEIAHQNINPDKEKRLTIIAAGNSEDEAVLASRELYEVLSSDSLAGQLTQINAVAAFVFTNQQAQLKSDAWTEFWKDKKDAFLTDFDSISESLGYRKEAFSAFRSWVSEPAIPENTLDFAKSFSSLEQLISSQNNEVNILSSIVVDKKNLNQIQASVQNIKGVYIVDGQSVASSLVNAIKDDFNLLLIIASITVFLTMLLVYGRIELTLTSFLPMVVSWIWILGIASLLDIKFNFINVMIATIIFGLGDDFAIFITDGFQSRYKYGKSVLSTHKAGILLSSLSTIIGTGVLFFGQHPAIKSIAAVSVIGISTIVLSSFLLQPFLYRFFILSRTEKGKPPRTLVEFLFSVYAFTLFIVGCFITTMLTAIIILIPFWKLKSKKFVVHRFIQLFLGLLINTMLLVRKQYFQKENLNFKKPSILIANHSSFLDILMLGMLHPKIIILVGKWVYTSPLFGWFIRFADYIPAFLPLEDNIDKIKSLVADGYSIVIFPEAHRSVDGKLKRFHKGAFYLSEILQLSITPILLHSTNYTLPKGEFYVKSSWLNLKVLPPIAWDDFSYGLGYSERAKSITKYYKKQFAKFCEERENEAYLRYPIQYAYLYKGPILEWYFKIKYKFESENYRLVNLYTANKKQVYDLGCGYGFLSYYLHLKDKKRQITAIDYDDDKISVAANCYLKSSSVLFKAEDLNACKIEAADVIVLSDVLHYLQPENQLALLNKCIENLQNDGLILLKDGFEENQEKHSWTLKSERWSTQWLKFNKTSNSLSFLSMKFIEDWAKTNHLEVTQLNQSSNSSNSLLLLKRAD